jgi:hypothetical protein
MHGAYLFPWLLSLHQICLARCFPYVRMLTWPAAHATVPLSPVDHWYDLTTQSGPAQEAGHQPTRLAETVADLQASTCTVALVAEVADTGVSAAVRPSGGRVRVCGRDGT